MRSPLLSGSLSIGMLVGCLGGCAERASAPAPPPVVIAYVEDAAGGARIDVTTVGRQALARLELLMPDGSTTPGSVIDHEAVAGGAAPGGRNFDLGVGVFGGSSSRTGGGVSLGFPIFGPRPGPEVVIRSRARIAVADGDAYRRAWQQARVRLVFTMGPDGARRDLAAPQPGPRSGE